MISTSPAQQIDQSFIYILTVSVVILIAITAVMIYFVIRYRRSNHPQAANIRGNWKLEVLWIVIPTIIALTMFYSGWTSYLSIANVPDGALEIEVEGEMYAWIFTYPEGRDSEGELVVPLGKAIAVNVTSNDVIHSFFIPAFRLKVDAVGGMHNRSWFLADKIGEYDIHCAEFCGEEHSNMNGILKIVSEDEYQIWLKTEPEMDGEW